ncbi:NAD(P)/FAD-dependent oxidoreductase [Ferrimonas balearica]|uniref:NAD(P)/FAD-dependent oxidoreductase n=1 Tax=Ferrimonas balearica TaxID=44012 RepID=UPI001C591F93|nr:NAD(P)/FAD-dependent oxidoreductase [Ferrimonas balearica]MBY6017633.1 NAD(P)/FAD-dependent oxidoreductase [Halomonas denitrificans]MBW3139875.1 NAD(P)/FAD-dependent oxidoreductase [Ferrimonas balearica]MBW3164897.1 NAD(P)/FAD-dependent oxidoreductase [Ferrimonas balearica]MBY5980236.1 NAD(P)/FAD-dependent oxidoreductase [Ferrimonas balearica]MBY6093991.1 NAD(P)/FAD-dependent oxidoreductase [Ferrimonas balearica]
MTNIVIVGGGAGGMEIVTKLGRKLGRKGKAQITLVDQSDHHIWKPLLHELATGSLDEGLNALDYRVHASQNGYRFEQGTLHALDQVNHQIVLAPIYDNKGIEVLPERRIDYDYLVLGVGAITNDFGIPGVKEHCDFLDLTEQAMGLRKKILNRFLRYAKNHDHKHFEITIVGAGATGVEMAAEMHHAADTLRGYGYEISEDLLRVTLVEAADRVLPRVEKPRICNAVAEELEKLGVVVKTHTRITEVTERGMQTADGEFLPSDLMIWSAGVMGHPFLTTLGLETNRANQILVKPNCQVPSNDRIFAFGDCAACPQPDGSFTPPRGQTARQMALMIGDNIQRLMDNPNAELKEYVYKDLGSLVNLSKFHTVGNLMSFMGGGIAVEGKVARLVYTSLYRRHMIALHGPVKGLFLMGLNGLQRLMRPELKLH